MDLGTREIAQFTEGWLCEPEDLLLSLNTHEKMGVEVCACNSVWRGKDRGGGLEGMEGVVAINIRVQ